MRHRMKLFAGLAAVACLAGTSLSAGARDAALQAHDAYIRAINANDTDAVLAAVTDDIVLIAPNAPALAGKRAVAPWVAGYFGAVTTRWHKRPVELVVSGDWAMERYVYSAIDRPRDGGRARMDRGNGINIYRLEDDGVWRVSRDVWASERGAGGGMTCAAPMGPC